MNDLMDVNIGDYFMPNQFTTTDSDKKILLYRYTLSNEKEYVLDQFKRVKKFRDLAEVLQFAHADSMEQLEKEGIFIERLD